MSTTPGPRYILKDPDNKDNSNALYFGTGDAQNPTTYFKISGVANTAAADIPSIVNGVHSQASVYTLGDSGQATANIGTTGTLVSGNLPKASGTTGYMVDSGISATSVSGLVTQVGNVTTVNVTMNTATVTSAYATPVQLVAAPGAGKTILVQEANVYTASTGNTAYATGTSPVIQYDSTVHGAGTAATTALATGDLTASASQIKSVTSPTGALTGITNKGIFFSNATGAYTNGTGTSVTISLTYQTVTATV